MKKFSNHTPPRHPTAHGRVAFMKIGVACCALVLVVRMFSLQVIGYADYKAAAEGEHTFFKKLFPKRGEIFIRELKVDETLRPFLVDMNGEKVFPAVTNHE